jgi:cyclic pyranopterin phosphate synthase
MKILTDSFGRIYKYLRISVTDRCNYKCKYCTSYDNFPFINHNKILTYEDVCFLAEVLSENGISKLRITGGEPLIRRNLPVLIKSLCKIKTINEVTLTTNGSLLHKFAKDLLDAGIRRINISLDSLRDEKYSFITGGFDINIILNNIKLVQILNFKPIKINTVIVKGFNDDEIIDFCNFAADSGVIVRFIEFMPAGNNNWDIGRIIKSSSLLKLISQYFNLIELSDDHSSSRNYRLSNGAVIGLITPISNHFCFNCDKLRLTVDGKIKPCLLADIEIDLFDTIRHRDASRLIALVEESLSLKGIEHNDPCRQKKKLTERPMSSTGG